MKVKHFNFAGKLCSIFHISQREVLTATGVIREGVLWTSLMEFRFKVPKKKRYKALLQDLNSPCEQKRQALSIIKTLAQHAMAFLTFAIEFYLKKKYLESTMACKKCPEIRGFLDISHSCFHQKLKTHRSLSSSINQAKWKNLSNIGWEISQRLYGTILGRNSTSICCLGNSN